ncbi:hypothetical protein ACFL4W_03925 [Planctomycetota bacterium]
MSHTTSHYVASGSAISGISREDRSDLVSLTVFLQRLTCHLSRFDEADQISSSNADMGFWNAAGSLSDLLIRGWDMCGELLAHTRRAHVYRRGLSKDSRQALAFLERFFRNEANALFQLARWWRFGPNMRKELGRGIRREHVQCESGFFDNLVAGKASSCRGGGLLEKGFLPPDLDRDPVSTEKSLKRVAGWLTQFCGGCLNTVLKRVGA